MKPRIAFLNSMLAPYRVSFYTKLFNSKEFEWKLFAGFKMTKLDARPQYEGKVDFPVSYHKQKISAGAIYNMIDFENMTPAVKEYNPDIIIMPAHVGIKNFRDIIKWAKKTNRKIIMWTSYWEPYYISGYKKIIRDIVIKTYYKKADYHITYSTIAREKLINIGYPHNQISIAYNGIDVDSYNMEQISSQEVFEFDSINILYCGGFAKDKKVDLLIKAVYNCMKLHNYKICVYLIGVGPTYKECESLINQLSLSEYIKLLGRIEYTEKYFKMADFIVMPGIGGLLLNEAVLFGKPFITSDADGTEYDLLINGFNGLKFLRDNEFSLENSLVELIENLPFYKENATKVTEMVTRRSNIDTMVTTFLAAVKKIPLHTANVRKAGSLKSNTAQKQL